jgi:hypothetical protein
LGESAVDPAEVDSVELEVDCVAPDELPPQAEKAKAIQRAPISAINFT